MPANSGRAERKCLALVAADGKVAQHRLARALQPSLTVGVEAGLLDIGDQLSPFVAGDPVARGGLYLRQLVGTHDHSVRRIAKMFHAAGDRARRREC